MSDTNRVNLAYVKEVSYGVFPSGPPTLKNVRFTSESLSQQNDTVVSNEIRADRQTPGLFRVGIGAPGDLGFEFSHGAFDDFLEWMLLSDATWTTPVLNTVTASITTGGVLTGTNIGLGLAAGQWVEVRGFVNAGNNGYFKIATWTSANSITIVGTLTAFVNETTVAGVTTSNDGEVSNGVRSRPSRSRRTSRTRPAARSSSKTSASRSTARGWTSRRRAS